MLALKDIGSYLIATRDNWFWLCKITSIRSIDQNGAVGKAEGIRVFHKSIDWYNPNTEWFWDEETFKKADLNKLMLMPDVKLDGNALDFFKGFLKELAI